MITRTQNQPVNRHSLLVTASKLWCRDCQALRAVIDFFSGVNEAKLDCNHRRGLQTETTK